jgi:hypothetical protein
VEPGVVKEDSGDGHLFPWGSHWETWDRPHIPGSFVWKKVLGHVSLRIGALLETWGWGSLYQEL